MELNVKELLRGNVTRLRYITRFSNCRRNHNESVAEHSYYVLLYAMMVANECCSDKVDWEVLYKRCAMHDVEEALTGDFPRDFKYRNENVTHALNNNALNAYMEIIRSLFDKPVIYPERPISQFTDMRLSWANAKSNDLEGMIVALADFMSVISYMYQEWEAGNAGILQHGNTIRSYADQFFTEKYRKEFGIILNQIKPMVDDLSAFDVEY